MNLLRIGQGLSRRFPSANPSDHNAFEGEAGADNCIFRMTSPSSEAQGGLVDQLHQFCQALGRRKRGPRAILWCPGKD